MKTANKSLYERPAPETKIGFKTFEDLEAYKLARAFRKAMYGVTRRLPGFEKFELASQIRRASVSLTNNIAEGHGRYHYLDQIKFCLQARGSLEELIDDLNVCEDESYLPLPEIGALKEQGWRAHRVLAGYMRWLRERKQGGHLALHESSFPGLTEDELDEMLGAPAPETASTLQRFNASTKRK
jgi:four helix bundle protein